jgi:nitrogen PTS system EIIA component
MPHRYLSLSEVADYLHMTVEGVARLAKRGEIPHEMRGDRPVFQQVEIDAWASQHILDGTLEVWQTFHQKASARHERISQDHALFPTLMQAEYINPLLLSKTKPAILRDMAALADRSGLVYDAVRLRESLHEREELCSTALDRGIALLHPRSHLEDMFADSFVVLGRAVNPVPFGSPSGDLTDLFFLVCCQTDRTHLHTLARLSHMCTGTEMLRDLRLAQSAAEMRSVILAAEHAVVAKL